MKKEIRVKVGDVVKSSINPGYRIEKSPYFDPENSVDDLISTLNNFKKEYGGKYKDLSIDSEIDYEDYKNYYLSGIREETDLEYNYRIKIEETQKKYQEDYEKKQYEELKKKFEKGV